MDWKKILPWRRFVKPDTSDRADVHLHRVESQQAEVTEIGRELRGNISEDHFRVAWENVIRGGES